MAKIKAKNDASILATRAGIRFASSTDPSEKQSMLMVASLLNIAVGLADYDTTKAERVVRTARRIFEKGGVEDEV